MKICMQVITLVISICAVASISYAETGYMVTSDIWIKAVINTEEKGTVEAVWQKYEENITDRGDGVISGKFYASPADVSWGTPGNPELFVKIWFDAGGRIDVNFFHVSVPEIDVYSAYSYDGNYDQHGTATMKSRHIRHEYYGYVPALTERSCSDMMIIGTGGITGVYYPTGGALARIANQKQAEHGFRFAVESTDGSVYNINAVMAGELDFAMAQSDRQYQACYGFEEWQGEPEQDLRAVFSIYAESINLIAAVDSGIYDIWDLSGKRVNIGNPGSGQLQNSIDALTAAGIDYEKDIISENVTASQSPALLQNNRIDAFFYTVGHPSGTLKDATSGTRKVRFIPLTVTDDFLTDHPYYARSAVPMDFYPNAANKSDVETFGVKATFITSAKTPDAAVYSITKELFDNFEYFKTLHSAYQILTKEQMLEALSAPIHAGAMRYYQEVGLK
jgi:TRAP transporter TAXI family solute receptor